MLKIVGIEYVEIYGTLLAYHQQIIPIFSKLVITLMTIPLALLKEKYYQFIMYQTCFKEASKKALKLDLRIKRKEYNFLFKPCEP